MKLKVLLAFLMFTSVAQADMIGEVDTAFQLQGERNGS